MGKECLLGLTEEDMKVNIRMIKKKDLVLFIGIMVKYIKVIGKMEKKMEKEKYIILIIKGGEKVCGKMEKGSGIMIN